MLVSHIAKLKTPVVCVINKADIIRDTEEAAAKAFLEEFLPGRPVVKASAKLDEGVDEILIELFKLAPEGELLYPADAYTDQNLEFRISEIIREKAINLVTEEIPHAIYVEIADIERRGREHRMGSLHLVSGDTERHCGGKTVQT